MHLNRWKVKINGLQYSDSMHKFSMEIMLKFKGNKGNISNY